MTNLIQKELLLTELRMLARRGPIMAVGSGSNSIGKTLQSELGIAHSVSSRNSRHGYTITSTQKFGQSGGRTNLFACVADWKNSNIKSSGELAAKYGRPNPDKGYVSSLFCTTSSLTVNSFGLQLSVDFRNRRLSENFVTKTSTDTLLNWDVDVLDSKIQKLGHTAIVTGLPVDFNGNKSFHFRYVELLGKPKLGVFLELIEDGTITLDHLISQKVGVNAAREQGPLFKIRGDSRDILYDSVERFDLLEF